MQLGLFIPCYIDQLKPEVGIATLQLLERLQHQVDYPSQQICCGQPLCNSGFEKMATPFVDSFQELFAHYEAIVVPSGSCALHLKHQVEQLSELPEKIFELTQFIHHFHQGLIPTAHFPHKVSTHYGCHALRGIPLASASEKVQDPFYQMEDLLSQVQGLELSPYKNWDECCGFGGGFSTEHPELSAKMGKDRLQSYLEAGVEYVVGSDVSCLIHLEGLIARNKYPLKTLHISQVLNPSNEI